MKEDVLKFLKWLQKLLDRMMYLCAVTGLILVIPHVKQDWIKWIMLLMAFYYTIIMIVKQQKEK